jgi:UDP:flavonoid glycosyltransferase YjiC (YdhE family)
MRVLVAPAAAGGHMLPAIALCRTLLRRGHRVLIAGAEGWRAVVEAEGIEFAAADAAADVTLHGSWRDWATAGARSLLEQLQRFAPEVLVSDVVTPGPALAAEKHGAPWATLMPVVYPLESRGRPPYSFGLLPPRTRTGAALWDVVRGPLKARHPKTRWLSQLPTELNAARVELGLPTLDRIAGGYHSYGPFSHRLVLVATFPQLEYPRTWPRHVHVTGPMAFEVAHPEVPLPAGESPLVLVASSTSQDPRHRLVKTALEALADERVHVVAVINRRGESYDGPVPHNAVVLDWVSYSQAMPRAALVVCNGGHGTVVRSLAEGVPVLVCPSGTDQLENGARVTWAGAGAMVPESLRRPAAVRAAVRRILSRGRYAAAACRFHRWADANDGATRGSELLEALVEGRSTTRRPR